MSIPKKLKEKRDLFVESRYGDEDCDCGVVDAESNLRQALESFEWLLKEDTND